MTNWRVMLSPKLWRQFDEKGEPGFHTLCEPKKTVLAQSKGRCRMKVCPKKDDLVEFVFSQRVVMKGVVESEGFLSGTGHQNHLCNKGEHRLHAEPEEYAKILITETFTLDEAEAAEWKGQRTWVSL